MQQAISSLAAAAAQRRRVIEPAHPVRALVQLCALALIAILVGTGLSLFDERAKELKRRAHEIATLNRTLLEQTARAIGSVDFAIETARLQLQRFEDAGMWSENIQHQVLENQVAKLPQLRSMVLIGHDESVVASSCTYPAPRVQAGECVGLTSLQAPTEDRLLIDGPTQSTLDGKWLLPVGRRFQPADVGGAHKIGLIVAAVEPQYFVRLYDELGADSGIRIVLLMQDGTVVASSSHEPLATAGTVADHPAYREYMRAAPGRDAAAVRQVGGGHAELVSFGKVAGLPLLIQVSIDEGRALAAWRKHATNLAFGVAGAALILVTITILLSRQVGRNEALSAALLDSEARQRGIIDSAFDGILATDVYGRVVLFNHAAERIFGCGAAEALGSPLSRFIQGGLSGRTGADILGPAGQGGEDVAPAAAIEAVGIRQGGTTFPVEVSLSRLAHGDERLQIAMVRDITARKRAEAALAESHGKLREMAANLNNLRETEMARLARELHDELGQQLTGLKMDISWMQGRLADGPVPLRDKVEAMKRLVDDTLRSVRRISTGLRPPALDDLGLVPALEWLTGECSRRHDIDIRLDVGAGEERHYGNKLATTLFRIVQESLTNVVRHAGASRVDISLDCQDGLHTLTIADDGRGFDPGAGGPGLGLVGMRERAYMCGGLLELSSRPGEGTVVVARVPDRDSVPDH